MYSLTIGSFSNNAQTFKVSNLAGLPDLMDKFLVAKRNGEEATLSSIKTRKVLRSTQAPAPVVVEKTDAPLIKLSDAMKRALSSGADGTGVLLEGKANTIKALEAKGLVSTASGMPKLTNLGRQYSRV